MPIKVLGSNGGVKTFASLLTVEWARSISDRAHMSAQSFRMLLKETVVIPLGKVRTLLAGISIAIVLAIAPVTSFAQSSPCSSQCLSQIMQSYLDHMVKHDPAGLAVAPDLNAREGGEPLKLGDGAWKTVTKIRAGDTFTDPSTGAAVFYGAVDTSGRLGSLFLRLKVQNRKITESEISFNGGEPGAFFDPTGLLEPDILYMATVPPARRSTREQMAKIVDGYMEAIGQHKGSLASVSYRCDRYSAGSKFTNNPEKHAFDKEGGTCASSLDRLTGQEVISRRIPLIDVEKGIVVVNFIIPHTERPKPNATNVAEVIKIVDGKIRSIEEFSYVGKFPVSSGFEK
jgi:hypothetical protein